MKKFILSGLVMFVVTSLSISADPDFKLVDSKYAKLDVAMFNVVGQVPKEKKVEVIEEKPTPVVVQPETITVTQPSNVLWQYDPYRRVWFTTSPVVTAPRTICTSQGCYQVR